MIYHHPPHMHEFANPASQLIVNVSTGKYYTDIDQASINRMNKIIAEIGKHKDLKNGDLIDFISKQFLGTPYGSHRRIGRHYTPEYLFIDLNGLNCLTYIEYVEAFRRAKDASDFIRQVAHVRYKNDTVNVIKRRHFFSDWAYSNPVLVNDVAAQVSPNAQTVNKRLNEKGPSERYVSGIPIVTRDIKYIPSQYIDNDVINNLHVGDYIGIYSPDYGMDVTHVGIYTKVNGVPTFRNASSLRANMKVVDSPFMDYVKNKPGIVVFRISGS